MNRNIDVTNKYMGMNVFEFEEFISSEEELVVDNITEQGGYMVQLSSEDEQRETYLFSKYIKKDSISDRNIPLTISVMFRESLKYLEEGGSINPKIVKISFYGLNTHGNEEITSQRINYAIDLLFSYKISDIKDIANYTSDYIRYLDNSKNIEDFRRGEELISMYIEMSKDIIFDEGRYMPIENIITNSNEFVRVFIESRNCSRFVTASNVLIGDNEEGSTLTTISLGSSL